MAEDLEFSKQLFNQFSSLIDTIKTMNTGIARHIEAVGRFEVELVKLNRHANQARMDMIELKSDMDQMRGDMGQIRGEMGQIRGEMGQFRGEMGQFRTQITHQLDGILLRLDELENAVNSNGIDIKALQSDAVAQYNDVLNAIQGSAHNSILLRELSDRIEQIERRLGPQA